MNQTSKRNSASNKGLIVLSKATTSAQRRRVDNLPHETSEGKGTQLDAAVKELRQEIQADPRPVPRVPRHPDKSFKYQQ